jgi:hypothetical protein
MFANESQRISQRVEGITKHEELYEFILHGRAHTKDLIPLNEIFLQALIVSSSADKEISSLLWSTIIHYSVIAVHKSS